MRTTGYTRVVETWGGPRSFQTIPLTTSQLMWRREHAHRCWSQMQLFACWLVAIGCEAARAEAAVEELNGMLEPQRSGTRSALRPYSEAAAGRVARCSGRRRASAESCVMNG